MSEDELRAELVRWCERDGQRAVARICGVAQSHISLIINAHRSVCQRVGLAMGYRRVVSFVALTTDQASAA